MATGGRFDFAAWCETPFQLTLTGGSASGLRALVDLFHQRSWALKGCNGPKATVDQVAAIYGRPFTVVFDSSLHRLDAVEWPKNLAEIEVARPTDCDRELVRRWNHRFAIDCGIAAADSEPSSPPTDIDLAKCYLARDSGGAPVSMAQVRRDTPNSANISHVYTPENERGRGYASALVANVSSRILDGGKRFCTLYTDLANPTSNKIYGALGYRRAGDFRWIKFDEPW